MQARAPLVSKFAGRLVLESWKLLALVPVRERVPENAGVVGAMGTDIAPTTVAVGAPKLNVALLRLTLEITCVTLQVTVTGTVRGEPVAPACVATMLRLNVVQDSEPLVSRLLGRVVDES